jgi:hypothetical protein
VAVVVIVMHVSVFGRILQVGRVVRRDFGHRSSSFVEVEVRLAVRLLVNGSDANCASI